MGVNQSSQKKESIERIKSGLRWISPTYPSGQHWHESIITEILSDQFWINSIDNIIYGKVRLNVGTDNYNRLGNWFSLYDIDDFCSLKKKLIKEFALVATPHAISIKNIRYIEVGSNVDIVKSFEWRSEKSNIVKEQRLRELETRIEELQDQNKILTKKLTQQGEPTAPDEN